MEAKKKQNSEECLKLFIIETEEYNRQNALICLFPKELHLKVQEKNKINKNFARIMPTSSQKKGRIRKCIDKRRKKMKRAEGEYIEYEKKSFQYFFVFIICFAYLITIFS